MVSYPGDWIEVNILKTGNLVFEMTFVGDCPTTQRVADATDYLATLTPNGWGMAHDKKQRCGVNSTFKSVISGF